MIGNPLTILEQIESSNNYATGLALQGLAQHGHAVLARFQSAGKGQRGRTWLGAPGQNIALSVVLDMKGTDLSRNFDLSMAISLGVYDYIFETTGQKTRIKWPNDIYLYDRKAVGILIENKITGQCWRWAIAGIGINMNQERFPEEMADKAVSLRQLTGQLYDIEEAARQLCTYLETRYQQFLQRPDSLLRDYNEVLYLKDQKATLCYKGTSYLCRIQGVDAFGRLRIEGAPVPYFQFGEVQWLIRQPPAP